MAHKYSCQDSWRKPLARHLEEIASHLDINGSPQMEPVKLKGVLDEVASHLPLLGETLGELVKSLHLVIYNWDTTEQCTERPANDPFIRHRDWMEAGRAAPSRRMCNSHCENSALELFLEGWNSDV